MEAKLLDMFHDSIDLIVSPLRPKQSKQPNPTRKSQPLTTPATSKKKPKEGNARTRFHRSKMFIQHAWQFRLPKLEAAVPLHSCEIQPLWGLTNRRGRRSSCHEADGAQQGRVHVVDFRHRRTIHSCNQLEEISS